MANPATLPLSPSDILVPKSLPSRQGQSGSGKTTVPDATKLGLNHLWHNDERVVEVARAYRHDTAPHMTPTYDCGEFDSIDQTHDVQNHGKIIPSSRYREQHTRRLVVLSEATKADATRFAESQNSMEEIVEDDCDSETSSESEEDPDAAIGDSGGGNMLGIPLDRPPSLAQRTLDCGAAVALSLLSSVALESPILIRDVLRNIDKWLDHCVPCSLSPHTGYATMMTGGTVRRLLSFLLTAWQRGHPAAVKLAIQLALSRGELPLLVDVSWGLVTQEKAAIPPPSPSRKKSKKDRHKVPLLPGEAVMEELTHAREFLFSTYCPSRRLALPAFLRGEKRVAVGVGAVQGLAVSGGTASVLIATPGHKTGAALLQMAEGIDRRVLTPFPVDADSVPSVASLLGGGMIAVASSAVAVHDPKDRECLLFDVNVCDTATKAWKRYRIKIRHPHRPNERVMCKVVSFSDTKLSQEKVMVVLATSSVPVDEKSSSSANPSSMRRLLMELQGHHQWEVMVTNVRAGDIELEAATNSLIGSISRDTEVSPHLQENIADLLMNASRADKKSDEDKDVAISRASAHWVSLEDAVPLEKDAEEEIDLNSRSPSPTPSGPTAERPSTPATSPGASSANGSVASHSPRSPTHHDPTPAPATPSNTPVPTVEPTRSVILRIPGTRTRGGRHRQSALSLTRNSLPEFSHALPKISRSQPCTLEAWVRGAVDSPATILCWGTPEYRVHLSIDRQKRHTLYFVGSTTKHQHRGVSASVPGADSHHWVHLCVTYDGASGWALYRNGNLIGEPHLKDAHDKPAEQEDGHGVTAALRGVRVPRTSSIPDMRSSDRVMHGSLGNAFVGCVAEARVWSEARTADQVRAYLHTSLRGHDLSTESNLLAYWPMDQSVGVVAFDHSAHRRHLLLQDGAGWEHVPDMPVFRRTDAKAENWPTYIPSLRGLSMFVADKELMLSVPKMTGGTANASRVISTYDAKTGTLLREKLIPIGLPVLCQGVADGSEGGTPLPLDGPLALDTVTGDVWALSQPTGLLASGSSGGVADTVADDEMPTLGEAGDDWPRVAGKGILNMLGSLAQRHTPTAPSVLSSLYLSPVVSCLKTLCRLLALGCQAHDVDLCKGAARLLNACFSQNGWSSRAIYRHQDMLEELFNHAVTIVNDNSAFWTTPSLTNTVEELLRSGVSAGVFFPSTTAKVAQFQKLLHQGWGSGTQGLSPSERTVMDVLVNALAGASAHYLLKGESVSQMLKQLVTAVRHADAPPLLPLASALQRCVIGLATRGEAESEQRLCNYLTELFSIAKDEPHDAPIAISNLAPILVGSLFLLHSRLTPHCDLVKELMGFKTTLIKLADSQRGAPIVSLTEAASTFWHELRLTSSGSSLSCSTYEFGAATSVALTIDSVGDYSVVYWDPNRTGSLLQSAEISEIRPTRVTLETSRLVIAEVQVKDGRRRRRATNERDSARPVSGVLRAFGTEMAPRIGWLLDLITSVFMITVQIACHAGIQPNNMSSTVEMEWVTGSVIFRGGIVEDDSLHNDICLDLLNGTEEGLRVFKELQAKLYDGRQQNGGYGTTTMLRAMLAALARLTHPFPVPATINALAPLMSVVELHRDAICLKLGDDGDDMVIDTFVKRCEFIVRSVRDTGVSTDNDTWRPGFAPPTRKRSAAELGELGRRMASPDQHDDNVLLAAHELLRLCTSPNLEVKELHSALVSQKNFTEKRREGFATCVQMLNEVAELPLEKVPRGFIFLEVLRVVTACVAASGSHPLAGCHGAGPTASSQTQSCFFDILRTAFSAEGMTDPLQQAQLEALQMALLQFDWNASDLFMLVEVGALRKLHDNCSLPAVQANFSTYQQLHLSPDLWRGAFCVGRGLLTLKLTADALGAAVFNPPGTENNTAAWACDQPLEVGASATAAAAETEVLHTVTPWKLDPPNPNAPRDATCQCEYYEVRVSSLQPVGSANGAYLDRDRRSTIAIGLARSPTDGGAPSKFVWWKSDGSFASELRSEGEGEAASSPAPGQGRPNYVGYTPGNTIGCGVLRGTNEVFFTRNGHLLGFHAAIPGGEWYPSIWLGSKAVLQCRFCPPFRFASRHPFVRPLSEVEVLNRRVRAAAWRTMSSVAFKAAKYDVTHPDVINPITSLISSGIETVLTSFGNKVKWIHARAALSVLVRVAAGKGVLKPLVIDGTTKALFRLACDSDAPLVLRVQALGVLCPVVSQSPCNIWKDMIQSVLDARAEQEGKDVDTTLVWTSNVGRAASHLGIREEPLPQVAPIGPELPGSSTIRLLENLMVKCSPFRSTGTSALAVASSCLLRALLSSPSWQKTMSLTLSGHLQRFAESITNHRDSFTNVIDSSAGTGFFIAMRVLGALPALTECGMRVLVHSPGTSPMQATVTEWHPTLPNACVVADGVSREVAVSRLEPADGPAGGSCPMPPPNTGYLLKAALDVAEAAFAASEHHDTEIETVKQRVKEPLPYLKWLAEVSCEKASDAHSTSNCVGLLYALPNVTGRSSVLQDPEVRGVVSASISKWVLVPALKLVEAYALYYPKETANALLEREALVTKIASSVYTPKRGWVPEVALAPSRAHLEVMSVHQIQQLQRMDWGVPEVSPMSWKTRKRGNVRQPLRIESRLDFVHLTERGTHSCDGCGYHPLQVDVDWQIGWFRCNTCTDFDLCGRCFRRGVVHVDHGHTFTDISQLIAPVPQSPLQAPADSDDAPPTPSTPRTPSDVSISTSRTYLTMLLAAGGETELTYLQTLASDMASGGSEIASLFTLTQETPPAANKPASAMRAQGAGSVGGGTPQSVSSSTSPTPVSLTSGMLPQAASAPTPATETQEQQSREVSDYAMNTAGIPAAKGQDGLYHCGTVVDGAQCRCGYCQMFSTNRCGPNKGCSCADCQALDRLTPDCVVDIAGINHQVSSLAAPDLWISLYEVSTALVATSSRHIISLLVSDTAEGSDITTPTQLSAKLPDLMDWKTRGWEHVGDFLTCLCDLNTNPKLNTTACMSIVDSVISRGGGVALHTLMGRLLATCCEVPPTGLQTFNHWKVLGPPSNRNESVRVSSAPSMAAAQCNVLRPHQTIVEVQQCGKWLRHQHGWSPIEWNGVPLLAPMQKQREVTTSRNFIFVSLFDSGLAMLRPLLLDKFGAMARNGRWPLSHVLPSKASAGRKGVSVLAALVACAHMHTKTKRRDALALVADLVQVYMKHSEGNGPPLAVVEGVEAMSPLILHVLSACETAPLSNGADVWHAALELLVRLRRGLASAGASDLLDSVVKTPEARKSKDSLFSLVESFEDCVERISGKPSPFPSIITTHRRAEVARSWDQMRDRASLFAGSPRRRGESLTYSCPTFLPTPVPPVDTGLINAYRWSRPSAVRESVHPVLSVKQWSALSQLVSSTISKSVFLLKFNPDAVYRALRHHINPTSSDATGITEIAGGISVPLPDLTKAELNACLTTLRNVNIMLLMPIVYFIDLTPHGIQHSRLSQKFMSIKGLLITECKDVIIESALRTTEVEPPSRPCLSFNRYPTSGADELRVDFLVSAASSSARTNPQQPASGAVTTTLLPQLHSHLCDGKVQLACPSAAFVVKFLGEEGIDVGGLYKDLLSSICQELITSNLLIACDDCRFYLNHTCTGADELALLGTLGRLMGSCLRTGDILGMDLHPLFWKKLAYEPCEPSDHFDTEFFRTLDITRTSNLTAEQFDDLMLVFAVQGQADNGRAPVQHDLIPGGRNIPVTLANRNEYADLAAEMRIKEGDLQISVLRQGILEVVPNIVLALLSGHELATRVCGRQDIDVDELKKHARYHESIAEEEAADLWVALRSFSLLDRQRFLRFVTGRPRMPLHVTLQIRVERTANKFKKDSLPMSHTCFNTLSLPRYSDGATLRTQLLTAIRHCDTTDVH